MDRKSNINRGVTIVNTKAHIPNSLTEVVVKSDGKNENIIANSHWCS